MARQNLGDRPVGAPVIYLEYAAVADGELPAFSTLLLESASQRRFVGLPGLGTNVPHSSRTLQHHAFLARQLLPSSRIASHQGRSAARLALISPSRRDFTSFRSIAPTILRASSSVAAKARKSFSRCPLATGSPSRQRTNSRYAPNGRSLSSLTSVTISTL